MAMSADFELVRAGVALAMLTSASYFDLKKREVSDLLWLVFAVAAGIIYVFDFPSSLYEGIAIVISISITAGVAYGVYRAGLFGGADMLALITLSVIMPLHGGTPLWETRTFHYIAPMIVFTNAIIFSVAQVGVNIIRNAAYNSRRPGKLFEGLEREPMSRKVIAMIIGHRSDNPQFDFPIEKTVGGRRKFDFAFKNAETADYEERKDVWVMSGIPFLVYFTIGFLFMIVVGDVFAIIFHLPIQNLCKPLAPSANICSNNWPFYMFLSEFALFGMTTFFFMKNTVEMFGWKMPISYLPVMTVLTLVGNNTG